MSEGKARDGRCCAGRSVQGPRSGPKHAQEKTADFLPSLQSIPETKTRRNSATRRLPATKQRDPKKKKKKRKPMPKAARSARRPSPAKVREVSTKQREGSIGWLAGWQTNPRNTQDRPLSSLLPSLPPSSSLQPSFLCRPSLPRDRPVRPGECPSSADRKASDCFFSQRGKGNMRMRASRDFKTQGQINTNRCNWTPSKKGAMDNFFRGRASSLSHGLSSDFSRQGPNTRELRKPR